MLSRLYRKVKTFRSILLTYLLHTIHQEEWKIINNCNEIYGACRHKTRFHRFLKEHTNVKNTSTDEGNKPEKVYKYNNRDGLSDLDDS
jgi:hypothetical protein